MMSDTKVIGFDKNVVPCGTFFSPKPNSSITSQKIKNLKLLHAL